VLKIALSQGLSTKFEDLEDARLAREAAAALHYGEFAPQ